MQWFKSKSKAQNVNYIFALYRSRVGHIIIDLLMTLL